MNMQKYKKFREVQEKLTLVYNRNLAYPLSLYHKLPTVKARLSMLQSHVMAIMYNNRRSSCDGDLTMGQLAKTANIAHNSLTRMIDSLVKKEFVETRKSETDRRATYVLLTEKGIAMMALEGEIVNEYTIKNIERLLTESDLDKVIDYYEHIIDIFERFA